MTKSQRNKQRRERRKLATAQAGADAKTTRTVDDIVAELEARMSARGKDRVVGPLGPPMTESPEKVGNKSGLGHNLICDARKIGPIKPLHMLISVEIIAQIILTWSTDLG